MTDAEWALVSPLIRPAKRGGRPRTVDAREVLNAIFNILWTGCQWSAAITHAVGAVGKTKEAARILAR